MASGADAVSLFPGRSTKLDLIEFVPSDLGVSGGNDFYLNLENV